MGVESGDLCLPFALGEWAQVDPFGGLSSAIQTGLEIFLWTRIEARSGFPGQA